MCSHNNNSKSKRDCSSMMVQLVHHEQSYDSFSCDKDKYVKTIILVIHFKLGKILKWTIDYSTIIIYLLFQSVHLRITNIGSLAYASGWFVVGSDFNVGILSNTPMRVKLAINLVLQLPSYRFKLRQVSNPSINSAILI